MHDESPEAEHATLIDQLEALGRDLAVTRAELSRLSLEDVATEEIPTATAELFAIVAQTEGAADRIMANCETLDQLGMSLAAGERPSQKDASRTVFAATGGIYAACGFQDLTGQRVAKVIASLRAIEERMAALTVALGGRRHLAAIRPAPAVRRGPQLPADAMSQSDVDVLLREIVA